MSRAEQLDAQFMQRALDLAQRAWGLTHPNPMVGSVIVEQGNIVSEGWHRLAGQAHAEIEALHNLGRSPQPEASLYVTLEPCSTHGQTGACTQAIIKSGIRRVVVGAVDPNPAHAGKGLDKLRAAGITVIEGVLAQSCRDLNLIFNHWIVAQRPLMAAKMALTLDGKFAAASGHSQWVTGPDARADVMRWRRYFPAIAVSAATVLADNPSLTYRHADAPTWCPIRFVFDRQLRSVNASAPAQLYSDAYAARTIVLCAENAPTAQKKQLERAGVSIWPLPVAADGHLDFAAFQQRCISAAICGVYIETGPGLATALLENHQLDYCFVYQAPKFMSDASAAGIGSKRQTESMQQAFTLSQVKHQQLGEDSLLRGKL